MARPSWSTPKRKPILVPDFVRLMAFTRGDSEIQEHSRELLIKLYTLLYYTGCRINELRLFTVWDIQRIIRYWEFSLNNNTKTKKPRLIYFSDRGVKEIKKIFADDLRNRSKESYIFRKRDSGRYALSSNYLQVKVNSHIQSALWPYFSSHSFRSGVISDMALNGINTRVIQEFIGHSSSSTTLRYVKPSEQDIKKSIVC